MLSGGACVVLFVIICVRASSVHQIDKEPVEQEPTFYDDYHPERTARSDEVREKTDFEKHTLYSEYGGEKRETRDRPIVITLIRQDKSQKNVSSANNDDNDYYYINNEDYEKLDRMGDEEYDDYEDQEHSNDDSYEEYDNPYRRQESGQYHYTYQTRPAIRTRHRTKNNWYHPPGDKYSSNVVGYSIQVKHPTLPTHQYSNGEQHFDDKFRHEKTKGFETQIKYFDGSLNAADKFKKLQVKFNNGFAENQDKIFAQLTKFKDQHSPSPFNSDSKFRDLQVQFNNEFTENQGILNQFNHFKHHQSPSSEIPNTYYSIPNRHFTSVDITEGSDNSHYSPQHVIQPQYEASDLKSFSSDSPEFIAFINSLKSNNFEQPSDIKTREQNHQISGVSTDQVPMFFRYADHLQSNSYDLENQATSGDSTFEEDSNRNFEDEGKIKTITFTENVPFPVKVEKQVPVPIKIPVDKPYPIYIPKPVPVRVHKPVPVPIKVPVPKPYPVQKIVPYPVKVQVPRSFPVPVNKPYPVYFFKKVPYAVIKPRFYPIKVPVEKPVPYAVTYNKYVPVPVYKDVPVPVKIPFHENIKIDVEYEKPTANAAEEIKAYATNYNYTQVNNEVKLPVHIPLDKVKQSYYYEDDEDDDAEYDDKSFDKETLALYSMNRFPEESNPTKIKHKEPDDQLYHDNQMQQKDTLLYFNFDHYPDKPEITYSYENEEHSEQTAKENKMHDQENVSFFNFNKFPKNPKATYAHENNDYSNHDGKMTKAIFNLDHYPEKQNSKFSEEVGDYSSNKEQVYNKKTKALFSMDLYPEKQKSTFPKQVEEHAFKEEPEYFQKNKAYPSDIQDSKQLYVVKDYTSRGRLRESEKDKAEEVSDSGIQENDSKSHSEEEGKHALHYHDILRVKTLRPSLHKIKISKIRPHKKSSYTNENSRNETQDDSQSSSSSLQSTKVSSAGSVWRGSKRYTPSQDSYDYDSRKYDSSEEESSAYKSQSERNGFGVKETSEISREIKTNGYKEENGAGTEHSTQSSVTPNTTTRQPWSTNHTRRRNRHGHRQPSRQNSTLNS